MTAAGCDRRWKGRSRPEADVARDENRTFNRPPSAPLLRQAKGFVTKRQRPYARTPIPRQTTRERGIDLCLFLNPINHCWSMFTQQILQRAGSHPTESVFRRRITD
jgi:hypothetical protein